MAVQQNFRSALNGFNREDVVHYIEYLNAKHVAEVNRLNSELEFLRGKQPAAASPAGEVDPALEKQAARIRELFDENNALKEEKTGLEEQLAAARAENEQLKAQLDTARTEQDRTAASLESALKQKNTAAVRAGEELEAYRRAERTERMARERAEQMYRQATGVIADATTRVDETAGQIGEMTDRVLKQLLELQNAVSGSKQALQDAAATLYAIRPETEE